MKFRLVIDTKILVRLLIINILVAHLFDVISKLTQADELNNIKYFNPGTNWIVIFITSVIIAPVIETFFAQQLVIEILYRNFKGDKLKIYGILISALVFGAFHWYNVFAIIAGFITGIILAWNYMYFREKGTAFLQTALLHAAYNFYAFLITDVLNKI